MTPKDKSEIRVLVVEDEPFIQNFMKRSLAGHGCAAESAFNGCDALDRLMEKGELHGP